METWEKFESNSTKFLNITFGDKAIFTHEGGFDSTKADIRVQMKTGDVFYIEAKHCPAQCGQFVLIPNLNTLSFDYSKKNITTINPYAQTIINHMNMEFDSFKEAGTKGKAIIFDNDQEIFASWIIDFYKSKKVKFIITNNYKILPISDFAKAFTISAKYRVKRSGSSSVGRSKIDAIKSFLSSKKIPISSLREESDKLYITSTSNLHNTRFIIDGTEYMISLRENEYEIRKLSNTFNANVIFSISLNSSYVFPEQQTLFK